MLFDGMLALAAAAVVDHARSARHQPKGLGPGLVPFVVGAREESAASPPTPVKFLLAHHPGRAVPQASFLGCPVLGWASLYRCSMGVCVPPLLVSVLVQRWWSCRGSRWGVGCVWGGGGSYIHS